MEGMSEASDPQDRTEYDTVPAKAVESSSPTSSAFKAVRDWVIVLVVALGVALGIRTFVLQQFYISGPSMETTLFQPNRVLVNKLAYTFGDIGRGDVVVFDRVTSNGTTVQHDDLIKRVIGLENEVIEIKKCVVYVDGASLVEPYLPERETLIELGVDPNDPRCTHIYHGIGCKHCQDRGYLGRSGIFELMVMTPRIQELALQGVDSNVIKREARREGMRTLREDGAERVLEGQTTIEEIMRVTRDELMEEVATS